MNSERQETSGEGQSERFWEGHYRERDRVWSGSANAVLVQYAASLPPGTALDLGCAEGADAIWLAGLGWRVTAVDVSATAISRAAAQAEAAGVAARIDFQRHDLAETFPEGAFDLVSAQYLQSPVDFPRDQVLRRAASAVAPGGLLLIVTHASVAPWSWNQDPQVFPTPEEALAALDLTDGQWRHVFVGAPERQATGPNGETATVTDTVIAISRLV